MTLNLAKCKFAKSDVKFIGHFVVSGVRRRDPQRLGVLLSWSNPKQKRSFARCWEHLAITGNTSHIL